MNPLTNQLSPLEWNFKHLKEDELAICFAYEYAREYAKHSKRWHKLMKGMHTGKLTKSGKRELSAGWYESIKEIGSIFGKEISIPFIYDSGFVATPWQALDKDSRDLTSKQFNEQKSGAQNFRESVCLNVALQRDLPEWDASEATDFDSWVMLDRCFHGKDDQREYGFFALNWNYTDGQLIDEFRKWLAEKRGDQGANQSKQGKAKAHQHLKALGAKRLLDSGLTVNKAMEYTRKVLKDKPLYDSERGWSKAKNETVPGLLKLLFPAHK